MKLRRFHPLANYTLELLEQQAVGLSDITRFNDPLEEITINRVIKEIDELETELRIKKELSSVLKELSSVLKDARVGCLTTCFQNRNGKKITANVGTLR